MESCHNSNWNCEKSIIDLVNQISNVLNAFLRFLNVQGYNNMTVSNRKILPTFDYVRADDWSDLLIHLR